MTVRKSLLIALLFTLCLAASVASSPAEPRGSFKNVILVGWDGCAREVLKEMLVRKELPSLMDIVKEGAVVDITVTTGATDTKAGWAQILTGYKPETTGVYSNRRYQPIPEGMTILERVRRASGADEVYAAMVIAKKGNLGSEGPRKVPYDLWLQESAKGELKELPVEKRLQSINGAIVEEAGQRYVLFPGEPYHFSQKGVDLFINDLKTNERVGKLASEIIEKQKENRFILFVQFAEPDQAGHRYGEHSKEYRDAIRLDDEVTGRIVAKLKETGLYARTLIYIVADHGFDAGQKNHTNAPAVFCATNDNRVRRNGDRADIAPTILKRFGIDLETITPRLDGSPLDEAAPSRLGAY